MRGYKIRLCKNKDLYGLSWDDIANLINKETGENLGRDVFRKFWRYYNEGYEDALKDNLDNDILLQEYEKKKIEFEKEKVKTQTEKLELRQWIRESARVELFEEKLSDYLKALPVIKVPEYKLNKNTNESRGVICGIADSHYGKEILIRGLKNEILNEYNPEIFEQRMWMLLSKYVDIFEKENIKEVYFYNLGDDIDGILRVSQLMSLKYGIIESTMKFAEFMVIFLNELSKYVFIKYYSTMSNHSEIRPLNSKSGEFFKENVELIVNWHLKHRLKDNPNIEINECNNVVNLNRIAGLSVLNLHGQNERDLGQSVKDYSLLYGEKIDLLLVGHLHYNNSKTVGMSDVGNIDVVQFPSICGIDEFSMNLKRAACPGGKLIIIDGVDKIVYDLVL